MTSLKLHAKHLLINIAMTTDVLLYSGWSSEANNKPQYYEKMTVKKVLTSILLSLLTKYLQNRYTVNLNGLVKEVTAD